MTTQYKVENMKCGGCVSAVKSALEQLDGCDLAEVDLESATAKVNGEVDAAIVEQTLSALGYPTSKLE